MRSTLLVGIKISSNIMSCGLGSSRMEGGKGGDSEVQRTMLELLAQLDGFEASQSIKVSFSTIHSIIFYHIV